MSGNEYGKGDKLTQTKRIFLNVIATYGRSLLTLFCGIFTGRWVLEALGTRSYGVFGVVGVILGLVGVVNNMLSSSVGRYFAFAVGEARAAGNSSAAIEESCGWFNTAVAIHFIFSTLLVLIGYPLGYWAVKCYFDIPDEMRLASLWVFSFSMITTYVGMATVPFRALYGAHQYIAELTLYGVGATIANVCFAWYLLSYVGNRLWFNGFYSMLVAVVPNLLIAARAFWVFPECRIHPRRMLNRNRYKHLFSFAGWQIVGWLGLSFRFQGLTTLCNKVLGLEYNASMSVAGTVSYNTMTFAAAMNGAFSPAITNAAGAGDRPLFEALVLRSCKLGTIMCAIFIIPLCVEIDYVIHLWLKTVPPMVEMLCVVSLATHVVERLTFGFSGAVFAYGRIKYMEIGGGIIWVFGFCLACLFLLVFDMGIVGIPLSVFIAQVLNSVLRFCLAKWQIHIEMRKWFASFLVPFVCVSVVSLGIGLLIHGLMPASFLRLLVVVILSGGVFMLGSVLLICDGEERAYLRKHIGSRFSALRSI